MSCLLEWKGNGILTFLLAILQLFHSKKSFVQFILPSSFSVMWFPGFTLRAAGRSFRECCDSEQCGLRRAALLWNLLTEWKQSVQILWNSVSAFIAHYVFAGAIRYIGVYFIALRRCLICSSRAVHLHSGNSWHMPFWLGLEHLSYMHQKMKNQDIGRHSIPFSDYLRHSQEVRPKITSPSTSFWLR